jgi:hypothetical protein
MQRCGRRLAEWNHWLGELSLEEQFVDVVEFLDGLNPRLVVQSWEPCGDPWDVVVAQAVPRGRARAVQCELSRAADVLKAQFG